MGPRARPRGGCRSQAERPARGRSRLTTRGVRPAEGWHPRLIAGGDSGGATAMGISVERGALFAPGLSAPPGSRGENPRRVLPAVRVDEPARRIDVSLNYDSPGRRRRSVGGFIAFMGQQRNACASQAFRCAALHRDSRWRALPGTAPGDSHRSGSSPSQLSVPRCPRPGRLGASIHRHSSVAAMPTDPPAFVRLMPASDRHIATAPLDGLARRGMTRSDLSVLIVFVNERLDIRAYGLLASSFAQGRCLIS